MEKDSSPLDTLRQLKEWLDAGTITHQEFETLKKKLLFDETAAAPDAPAASTPTAAAPVEDPLLPPITHPLPPVPEMPAVPPVSAPEFSAPLEVGRPVTSPSAEEAYVASDSNYVAPEEVPEEAYQAPPKSPLNTILIVGGIVALLALVAYLMLGNRESERLTSATLTAADSLAVRPDEGPQAEQIDLPPVAAPETIRVAPAVPVAPADTAQAPVATPTPDPAASEPVPATTPAPDENAARSRIEGVLQSYYTDLQAAPFSAASYFAPNVERFYLQQNTTPAAINAELEKSHFPEFLEAQSTIEPGSLKVNPPANDGSRTVTFIEKSSALRQSLQKHQQTAAQVRVRFDKNFKIVYLRQEKLLENTFTD